MKTDAYIKRLSADLEQWVRKGFIDDFEMALGNGVANVRTSLTIRRSKGDVGLPLDHAR